MCPRSTGVEDASPTNQHHLCYLSYHTLKMLGGKADAVQIFRHCHGDSKLVTGERAILRQN